jgi:hypothetical protein
MQYITNYEKARSETVALLRDNPKLLLDKEWRMNKLYWVQSKQATKVLFQFNRAQQ